MNLITVKEASRKWNISERRITALCKQGRITGAEKIAGVWILPSKCRKPCDGRIKSGNYINRRGKRDLSSNDFEDNLKNVRGTLGVEDIVVDEETVYYLELINSGKATSDEIIDLIKRKYGRR